MKRPLEKIKFKSYNEIHISKAPLAGKTTNEVTFLEFLT